LKDTIMIVDDSKELRKVIKLYLENAGYETIEAENGKMALEILKEKDISLMILDIMMPEMDGFEVRDALGEDRKFPVIFLSARGKVKDKIKGLNLGGDDYISKPFDPGEVVARVMAVLRRNQRSMKKQIVVGSLKWDVENRVVYLGDKILELRAKEYKLLTLFIEAGQGVYQAGNI